MTLKIVLSKLMALSLIVCLLILSIPIVNVYAGSTMKFEDTIAATPVGNSSTTGAVIGLPYWDNDSTNKTNIFKVVEDVEDSVTTKCIKMTQTGLTNLTLYLNINRRTSPITFSGNFIVLETRMKLDATSGYRGRISVASSNGAGGDSSEIAYFINPSATATGFPNKWATIKILFNKTTSKYGVYINNVLSGAEATCDSKFFTNGISTIRIWNESITSVDSVQRSVYVNYLKVSDISGFDVASITPANNSFNIDPLTDKMTVDFTNGVDSSTFNTSNVLLYKKNSTVQVPITTSASGTQGIVNLPTPLDNSVDYTLTVKTAVKDIYGQPMPQDRNYRFIVKDSPGIELQTATFSCGSTLGSGNLTGTIPLKNISSNSIGATVILGLYKVDSTTGFNIYTNSVAQTKIINANTTEEYKDWSLIVPSDLSNYIVKAYVWDKFDQTGVPLTDPITLSKNGISYTESQSTISYNAQSNLEASELDKTGVIRVSGIASIPEKRIAIMVNDPTGKVIYFGQTKSAISGQLINYEHKYKLNNQTTTGLYSVFTNINYGFVGYPSSFNSNFNIDVSWYPIIASNVSIPSASIVSEPILGQYDYLNGLSIQEGNSIYRWLIADSADGQFLPIPNATAKTYTPTEADAYKLIAFEVTPYGSGISQPGQTVVSDVTLVTTYPEAHDVVITGNTVAGNILHGDYTYYQKVNNPESSETKFKWLRADSPNGDYTEIAQGITYMTTSSDVNKYIKFQVIPASNIDPKVGKPSLSDYKLISAAVAKSPSLGGSGGSRTVTISSPVVQPTPTPQVGLEPSKSDFSDVSGHWAEKDVLEMTSKGIVKGENGKFMPDLEINRASFVALVARVLKIDSVEYKNIFSDVAPTEWYAKELQSAVDSDLVSDDINTFRPNDLVTREEMTKIIIQAYKKAKGNVSNEGDLNAFSDANNISPWAEDFVKSAYGLGLINGVDNKRFDPKGNATRAQAVVIIKRLTEILAAK